MNQVHPAVWLIAASIYVLCPLDMDFIPIVGWVDDIVVACMGISKYRKGVQLREAMKAEANTIDVQMLESNQSTKSAS